MDRKSKLMAAYIILSELEEKPTWTGTIPEGSFMTLAIQKLKLMIRHELEQIEQKEKGA